MLVLGDFASCNKNIDFVNINRNMNILINCEGFLTDIINNDNSLVFNNIELYKNISKNFNLILNLSNNHTMDIPNGATQSIKLANKFNLKTVGAGKNLDEACQPFTYNENGVDIAIISGGWDVIGCKSATSMSEGVAPIVSTHLIKQVILAKSQGYKVLVYLHWDYELEIYPQPTHRNLAKELVDSGADIILGCHSHCMQGYEVYRDKYIFYGLGNSVFDENYYFNGKLKFPDFCKVGLAVDWSPINNTVFVAKTRYIDNTLIFDKFTLPDANLQLLELSTFKGLSSDDYVEFFKLNRRKKNFLPIFLESDTTLAYKLKRYFLLLRAFLIKQMFVLGLKGHSK